VTNQKKGWLCPVCPQTSSRRWNLEVHIRRKHLDLGAGVKPIWQGSYSANNSCDRRTNHNSPVDPQAHWVLDPAIDWLARQYQQDKKEDQKIKRIELERAAERDALDHYFRAMTINQSQNHSGEDGNGFGNISNLIPSLLSTGNIVLVQTIDTNGNVVFRYELGNISNAVPMGTVENSLSSPVVAELIRIIEKLFKRNKIIMQYMEAKEKGDDLKRVEQKEELKQRGESIGQGQGDRRSPSNASSQQMIPQQDIATQHTRHREYNPNYDLTQRIEDRKQMQSQQVMTEKSWPKPQPQKSTYQDLMAQQACRSCASSELMLGDEEYIKQAIRTQEIQKMERQRATRQKQVPR
jgi:hypothetical protein